jgi:hypothetical protein
MDILSGNIPVIVMKAHAENPVMGGVFTHSEELRGTGGSRPKPLVRTGPNDTDTLYYPNGYIMVVDSTGKKISHKPHVNGTWFEPEKR